MARSRLWKKTGATASLFNITSDGDDSFNVLDHHAKSITITRGGADSVFGTQEHTIEVDTAVSLGDRTDQAIRMKLTDYGAQLLSDRLGYSASGFTDRYFGRVGTQTITDRGGIHDASKWHASLYGSKWQSQLANSDRIGNQISSESVYYLMDHFMRPSYSNLDQMPSPEFSSPAADYGTMINDYDLGESKIPYSEFANKYLTAPGFYVQNRRTGADRVFTLKQRWDNALARMNTYYPLTRSQCLAPTTWEQPREDRPRNHRVSWRSPDGPTNAMTGPDVDDVRVPVVEHDVSHIRFTDVHQPVHLNHASYGAERIDTGYRLPGVTIDLLALISSDRHDDRRQAIQLLLMDMGDPVFLSGDWHASLDGILFATGIKETITADRWDIELSLTPSIAAVGEWSPPIPPRIWDSAHMPWNDETRKWDNA